MSGAAARHHQRSATSAFTPSHRGGAGPPLVRLHGITDTWRTWELVPPRLERRHDVLAVTLAGHAGGPALAPAGGWATGDDSHEDVMAGLLATHEQLEAIAPYADAIAASPEGRRRATESIATNFAHLAPELVAHLILGAARCATPVLVEHALRAGCCGGRRRPRATARTCWHMRTGSSSTASGTARSSTSPWRRRS